ncbi:unnamed protein product [Arctia plantaginis]|uniref:Uncharacterized protein n=1 Tax=Arctia plantaginis TaxID=874455 RepID=A0A8S0Z5D9_ARCPL|nr:unnamed protein product [Arctia plantaginis]
MADKMIEHFEPAPAAAITTTTTVPSCENNRNSNNEVQDLQVNLLTKQIEKMSLEIALSSAAPLTLLKSLKSVERKSNKFTYTFTLASPT